MNKIDALNYIYNVINKLECMHDNENVTANNINHHKSTRITLTRAYKAYEWFKNK